jgi:hypothetical protein
MYSQSQTELDWLAFRYVADELSSDERDEFELRLATDQSAREAVAAAVELLANVHRAEVTVLAETAAVSHPVVCPADRTALRTSGRRGGAWVVATAVALVAAVLLAPEAWFGLSPEELARRGAQRDRQELATLWTESSAEANDSWSEDSSDEAASEDDDDALVPGWMLAALSDQHARNDDGEQMEN